MAIALPTRQRKPLPGLAVPGAANFQSPVQGPAPAALGKPASGAMANPLLGGGNMQMPAAGVRVPQPQLGVQSGVKLGFGGQTPQAPQAGPAAAANPNQAAPGPADPRAGIEALYQQMLDANSKMGGQIQDMGQANIAALQRRNASNSALAGRSIGGGYLGGQRAMLTQGLGQMNRDIMQNDQARQNILGQQLQNRLTDQRRDEDWQRDDTIRGADAQAESDKLQRQGKVDSIVKAFENTVGKLSGHPWVNEAVANYLATGDEKWIRDIQAAIDAAKPGADAKNSYNSAVDDRFAPSWEDLQKQKAKNEKARQDLHATSAWAGY